jgi:quercetin dioxygenase-like cupin family protein
MPEPDVIDHGHDHIAADLDDRGMHIFDPDSMEWEDPAPRDIKGAGGVDDAAAGSGVQEKWLVRPRAGEDRVPISIMRFPPNFRFPRHWHTEGEFIQILRGTAIFAGRTLHPGDMAYNDARIVYGSEAAGPEGCDFLLIRRAWATTTVVGD